MYLCMLKVLNLKHKNKMIIENIIVNEKLNKNKTWLNNKYELVTREIKYRKFTAIIKQIINDVITYSILMSDVESNTFDTKSTLTDNYGRTKISLKSISNSVDLDSKINKNINLVLKDADDVSELYEIIL